MGKKVPRKKVDVVSLQLVREKSTYYASRTCNTPDAMYELFSPFIELKDREHLVVAGLNVKNEPTFIQVAHIGGINQSIAIPREILKPALLANSISICIAHNHPSGDTAPSKHDVLFTSKLEKACELLQLKLLDHLIIGSTGEFTSMRMEGYLNGKQGRQD